MDPLEHKLKRALAPEDPRDGFAGRVMARIRAGEQPRYVTKPARSWLDMLGALFQPGWRLAVAGAVAMLLVVAIGFGYQRHQERVRAEKAYAELLTALEITNAKLVHVQQVVRENSRPENSKQ